MNITKRLYTYPVLSEERNDYVNSVFDAKMQYKYEVNNMLLEFDIKMDNEYLNNMILAGDAEYVIHIECPNTSFRTTIHAISISVSEEIPVGRINGKIEITVLLVTKNDVQNFVNSNWNDDYKDLSFDLSKGSILAYKNIPSIDILKKYKEFNSTSSIFTIRKLLTDVPKPMQIDLSNDQIIILLGPQEYKIYNSYHFNEKFQPILNTMIFLPALVFIFEELKQENGIDDYGGKKWYASLSRKYKERYCDFEKWLNSDKTSIQLAQEVLELPINDAFKKFPDLFDNGDEEEDI